MGIFEIVLFKIPIQSYKIPIEITVRAFWFTYNFPVSWKIRSKSFIVVCVFNTKVHELGPYKLVGVSDPDQKIKIV